jgi:hypothetical protein
MSTPSEKNSELVELSDYLTRQMRDLVSSENPVEAESGLPRSPYAPKSAHERAVARLRVLANNDGDPASSPYAPKRARLSEAEPSFGPNGEPVASVPEPRHAAATPVRVAHSESVASVNAPCLSPESVSPESPQVGGTPPDKDGPANQSRMSARAHSGKHRTDPGAISAFAPARARNDEAAKPAPSEIWRRIMADQELARIETSLRLLHRRQIAGMRLPRGPNLALSGHPALPAEDTMGGSDSKREKVIEWFARPRSLEPTVMPPPPLKPARNLHVSLILAIACFAGAIAYYAFMPARSSHSPATTQIRTAAASSRARTPQPQGSSRPDVHSRAESYWAEGSLSRSSATQIEPARIETSQPTSAPSPVAVISEHRSLAKAESTDEEDTPSRANSAVRALEPEEIDVLLEQGERFIAAGDIVTARLIFERAAKAENATAALALAAAYDPIVLTKLGVLGIDMDVEKARLWYRKAESLGSAQAVQQLRALAER